MKKGIKILVAVALLATLLLAGSAPVFAQEAYTITDYQVNINVTETKEYQINETVSVNFDEYRHGITRYIPFRGHFYRDLPEYRDTEYRSRIRHVKVTGDNVSTEYNGDYLVLKIGDADTTIIGPHTYVISYEMDFGKDGIPSFDEFYQNIIGDQWDTTIASAEFSVTLPKSFDASKVGVITGSYGSRETSNVEFSVTGNTIVGKIKQPLRNQEGLTMRVQLPEGYFISPNYATTDIIILVTVVAAALLCLILFFRFGRDERLVQTVEVTPPEGMPPSEIGYIYDGNVDTRDVVSLIIHWASKGYLTIEQVGKTGFILHKVKDMDADVRKYEKYMFDALLGNRETVSSDELNTTFYTSLQATKTMVTEYFRHKDRRIFTTQSVGLGALMSLISALPVLAVMGIYFYRGFNTMTEVLISALVVGLLILLPVFFLIRTLRRWRISQLFARWFKLILCGVLLLVAMGIFLGMTMSDQLMIPALPLATALSTIVIALCAVFVLKRTPQGARWFGQVLGFKDFIERAEREKLVMLVEQDPAYFYNILPYAYVLGVTDKWAKKFESIALAPPTWYQGTGFYGNVFMPMLFVHSLNTSMHSMQTTMTSRPAPSSSNGGGFSGGGFSGGGFSGGGGGGGGGGSW